MDKNATTYKEKIGKLKCAVVIPTYNNAGTISQVIADVKRFSSDIIVVNDGSTDGTSEILLAIKNIRVIAYSKNRGKGYAIKLGLRKAYEWGFRYAITIDSDGQHYADDIPVFIRRIEQVPDSLLIGARNLSADNMPAVISAECVDAAPLGRQAPEMQKAERASRRLRHSGEPVRVMFLLHRFPSLETKGYFFENIIQPSFSLNIHPLKLY